MIWFQAEGDYYNWDVTTINVTNIRNGLYLKKWSLPTSGIDLYANKCDNFV